MNAGQVIACAASALNAIIIITTTITPPPSPPHHHHSTTITHHYHHSSLSSHRCLFLCHSDLYCSWLYPVQVWHSKWTRQGIKGSTFWVLWGGEFNFQDRDVFCHERLENRTHTQQYFTSHSMRNVAFHILLRRKMILLLILTTSRTHSSWKGWENIFFWIWASKGRGGALARVWICHQLLAKLNGK